MKLNSISKILADIEAQMSRAQQHEQERARARQANAHHRRRSTDKPLMLQDIAE
jgi:hypothetical protein